MASSINFANSSPSGSVSIPAATKSRDEYLVLLQDYMSPLILDAFYNIYNDCWKLAVKRRTPERALEFFQLALGEIKNWPESVVATETDTINKALPWVTQVLRQILITNCLILVSVRLGTTQSSLPFHFEVPPLAFFVHKLFIKAANTFRGCVDLFDHTESKRTRYNNQDRVDDIISRAVPSVVRRLIPLEKLVDEYFSSATTSASEFYPEAFNGTYAEPEPESTPNLAPVPAPAQVPLTHRDRRESVGSDDNADPDASDDDDASDDQDDVPSMDGHSTVKRLRIPHAPQDPANDIGGVPPVAQQLEQADAALPKNAAAAGSTPFRPVNLDNMTF